MIIYKKYKKELNVIKFNIKNKINIINKNIFNLMKTMNL